MRAASEVEQEERRRKPWMKIEVRGGGGFLVLGGALIAAGLGAAFAMHRAHINNKRRRSSMRPTDERCKVEESLNKGISFDGQLDEVDGEAARGFGSLMTLDPIPLTPSMKLGESCQGESSVHNITAEVQESTSMPKIDQSPTFKNLEIVVATEGRILDADTAACGDGELESGTVQKRNEKASKESELVNLDELKEETQEFSFGGVQFNKTQDNNKQILEESELAHDNDKEERDDSEEEEEALSHEQLEEFSFRAVESDTIRNQTNQTLEDSKLSHDKEENEEGKEEESSDDVEAPSSESQEKEKESSSVEEETEREEEGSDGTGASSIVSSFEAVWPAEAIEQQKDSSLLENLQVTEESSKEKASAAQPEQEIEEYDKFVEKELAVEELLRNEIGTGPKTTKMESEIGLMAVSYSNRLLLLLLILALAVGLISSCSATTSISSTLPNYITTCIMSSSIPCNNAM